MSEPSKAPRHEATTVAAAWAGALLAAIGTLGLLFAPSLKIVWIVLLVFAIAAVPQAIVLGRRDKRDNR